MCNIHGYSHEDIMRFMPKVGTVITLRPSRQRPHPRYSRRQAVVTYVNEKHLWYEVEFMMGCSNGVEYYMEFVKKNEDTIDKYKEKTK